jgi:putative SbcD/Mre11-related phosphoesterase
MNNSDTTPLLANTVSERKGDNVYLSSTAPILPGITAHPSGALWLPESQTILVADLHLGYGWAQRRRGELGPLADFQAHDKLLRLCAELEPQRIVFVGDLVHAPRPCEPERAYIEETLNTLAQRAEIIAVRGNHDRAFAREFGHLPLSTTEAWTCGDITAIHGDRLDCSPIPQSGTLVLGHLHPSLSIREASGAGQKLPVFLVSPRCIVMPAFSPFARGYDVAGGLAPEWELCFQNAPIQAYVATSTRVLRLGLLTAAIEKLADADASAPGRFRGFRRN